MHRLVLFDIDGTLLTSNRAAANAFRAALERVFGTRGPERHAFAGKTDPQIARELLARSGVPDDIVEREMPRFWSTYLDLLPAQLARIETTVYPGVRPLLDALERAGDDAVLGLLTGNLREGARLKLEAARLGFERFRVGAFGSDHAERAALPAIAVARAEAFCGRRFAGKEIVIVGDTPADIACGAHLTVRTLAVATGSYTADQLAACRPDHLFETLADLDAVWRAIFDGGYGAGASASGVPS